MTLYKIGRTNLLFVLTVVALNLFFFMQKPDMLMLNDKYYFFQDYLGSGLLFWIFWGVLTFVLCLFSFPGAGFSLSFGGYIWGFWYLIPGSVILLLSSLASFPFGRKALEKSKVFKKLSKTYNLSGFAKSPYTLFLIRMNPSVPFLFFAPFFDTQGLLGSESSGEKKTGCRARTGFVSGLLMASMFHALIYVFIGWNLKSNHLEAYELSVFTTVFLLVSLVPIVVMSLLTGSASADKD